MAVVELRLQPRATMQARPPPEHGRNRGVSASGRRARQHLRCHGRRRGNAERDAGTNADVVYTRRVYMWPASFTAAHAPVPHRE